MAKTYKIIFRYRHETLEISHMIRQDDEKRISFSVLLNMIRVFLRIDSQIPLVIKYKDEYHSTSYSWKENIKPQKLDFQIWHQIESSIEESESSLKYLPHLFKLQDPEGQIKCLGLFISPNVCLIPKKALGEDIKEKLKNHKIVFFQCQNDSIEVDQEFGLNEVNMIEILGDSRGEKPFCIIQFRREISKWVPKRLVKKNPKIRGNIIFFNEVTKMLSSERTNYVDVTNPGKIFYRAETDEMLPGAILVSDKSELVAIYTGDDSKAGAGKHFVQINQIYEWISDKLQSSIEEDDRETRKFLLDINGVELVIPEILEILRNIPRIKDRVNVICNPLNGAF